MLLHNNMTTMSTIPTISNLAIIPSDVFAFTMERSLGSPRAPARWPTTQGDYVGQTRLDTTEVSGRPPSTTKHARMATVRDSEAHYRGLQQRAAICGGDATVPTRLRPHGKVEMVEEHQ